VTWYRRAAEQGFAAGQFNFGRMYAGGRGIRQSDVEAYKWFTLASAQGHTDARKQLAEVAKRMTAEQITQAKQAAQQVKPAR
jgi:TPR repeat protein